MEAYLGRESPRWQPRTEQDIQDVIDSGLLAESHHIDVKRETGDSSGSSKETARDLASFSADGGALLIGLKEDKAQGTFTLCPQPLAGMAEKIEQIATNLIDPPLDVVPMDIVSGTDSQTGYLLVHIPPSPLAPHMADGRYWGRVERTKRQLAEPEVARLHARRRSSEATTEHLLDVELARDHVAPSDRGCGHLYLVAQPATAPRGLALELTRDDNAGELVQLVRSVDTTLHGAVGKYMPTPEAAGSRLHRAHGVALCSYAAEGAGRTLAQAEGWDHSIESSLVDIEFREDGGIRVLVGGMTRYHNSIGWIVDGLAVEYAARLVCWACAIGERCGYHGVWNLGVHADGLRGLKSSQYSADFASRGAVYDAESYRETIEASYLHLRQRPQSVANLLVGRLVRGLGTEQRYGNALSTPQPDSPLTH